MENMLLGVSIINEIKEARKRFIDKNNNKPSYLVLNAYTLSMLREELGHDDLYDLKKYKGLEILYTLSSDEGSIRVL
jgi:tRNA A37 threonylcarbamoyladenosine biosynthesis protein TsaE